jgi:hypothetical protein
MEIRRIGTQASSKGPSDWFTGTVRIDPLFQAPPRHVFKVSALRLSRAHTLHGTRIRWVKLLLSPLAAAGFSAMANLSRKFGREM